MSQRSTLLSEHRGAFLALASALLFGIATPAAKLLIVTANPFVLAGLLYLGSGIGLALFRLAARNLSAEQSLQSKDLPWLSGAILFGGVIGPVLLMVGLGRISASIASLMLTLEGVMTALMAWFLFKENFDRRIASGMAAIAAGAAILAWPTSSLAFDDLIGPACIVGACLAWGLDNNLTRKVALADPVQIAMLKGLVAGGITLGVAVLGGASLPSVTTAATIGIVGLLGYGISLVLFVVALRHIGTARTGAYFSTAPFIGAALSVLVLDEPLTWQFGFAGLLMAIGIWLHLTESHAHDHVHEDIEHSHSHRHDDHHRHDHPQGADTSEPHTHLHRHTRLRHRHAHFPDSHHQHSH